MTKDHYITVTASTPTSTPTDSLQVFKSSESSSSSGMTVGAKIGVGIGVPVAALALGLLGVFVWFRAVKRHRSKTPEMKPPWGVDAQESHLTPEEYERTKNQKPPEDDEVHATYDGEPDGPNAPPRSSFLQVSPLSRNRDSMATSSVNTTSPSVNYTPIPFNDLPELVDGPTK
ncbi:hypothetical protein BU16DRAFT_309958 [Lophium mytilinum]|uniref:Mid2 domain-containing protein n=1 Tax=Lophium mytilinum TaxID=390894 RepID=A0A6A6R334_9PEZI|nr:hypothetical protein BU16DRAFT_309958 [Lophium mytilinum]